jgi:hypothetical protein
MTTYETDLNCVTVLNQHRSNGNGVNHQYDRSSGSPIRFIPVEKIAETSGREEWSGSHGIVYRTKTGKLVAVLTDWSCIDGQSDHRTVIVGGNERELFDKLGACEFTQSSELRRNLAEIFEVVETI